MRLVIDPSAATSQIILNLLMIKSNSGPVTADEMIFVKQVASEQYGGFTYYNVANARYCYIGNGPKRDEITVVFKRFPSGTIHEIAAPAIINKQAVTTNPQEAANWIEAYVTKGDLPQEYQDFPPTIF